MCQCAGRDGDMRRCARAPLHGSAARSCETPRAAATSPSAAGGRVRRVRRAAPPSAASASAVRAARRAHFGRVSVRALELGAHARLVVVRVVGVGVYLRARGGERAQPRRRAWSGGDAPVNLTGGGAGSRHARALVISTTAHAASRAASCSATAPSARAAARLAASRSSSSLPSRTLSRSCSRTLFSRAAPSAARASTSARESSSSCAHARCRCAAPLVPANGTNNAG